MGSAGWLDGAVTCPHTWSLIQQLVAMVVAVPRFCEKGGALSHSQSNAVSEEREGGAA